MNRLKRTMALLIAASSVATGVISVSASDLKPGDVDGNGVVDAEDAFLALRYSVNLVDLDDDQIRLADLNGDGRVSASDSVLILRRSLGLDVEEEEEEEYEPTDVVSLDDRTQVAELKGWAPKDVIERVGPLFTADQERTGILASVSLAQFIVESGYGQSKLSLEANNCFGMKGSLSGNTWESTYWDGVSLYTIETKEQNPDGSVYTVTANFRQYACMEDSIGDHSQYLLQSRNGSGLRYEGLQGCTDYRKAIQIIKDGGYATAVDYVDVICSVIEKWDLTQYDLQNNSDYSLKNSSSSYAESQLSEASDVLDILDIFDEAGEDDEYDVYENEAAEIYDEDAFYKIRISWDDAESQIGAFDDFESAVKCADSNPGYSIFDIDGDPIYTSGL